MSYQERHRIYPTVDNVESPPPSAPAAPPHLENLEKNYPTHHHQDENFVNIPIDEQPLNHEAYPPLRSPPRPPPKKKQRGCFFKCFCWSLLTIILIIVIIAAVIGILYLVYKPKIPHYSVDQLKVSNFTISNTTASADLNVTVTAVNPNKKIGIEYKDGSSLTAWYNENLLASGSLPTFYQGYRNTTVFSVLLSGEMELTQELFNEFQQQQQTGEIPLTFRGDVPVRVKFGGLKLWKVTIKVRCSLVVNSLSSSSDISIRSSSCKFSKLKLFG